MRNSRLSVRTGVPGAIIALIMLASCSGPACKVPVMLRVVPYHDFSSDVPGWNDVRELVRKHAAAEEADTMAVRLQTGNIIVVEEQSRAVVHGDIAVFRPEFVKYLQTNSCLETCFGKWYQDADGIVQELPAKGVYICGYDPRVMQPSQFYQGGRELTKHEGKVYVLRDDDVAKALMALIDADGMMNYRWFPVPESAANVVVRKVSESAPLYRPLSEDEEDRAYRSFTAWKEAWRALPDIFGGHYIYDSESPSEEDDKLAGLAALWSSWLQDATFDNIAIDNSWSQEK